MEQTAKIGEWNLYCKTHAKKTFDIVKLSIERLGDI